MDYIATNPNNQKIVNEFAKLINQIKYDIDTAPNKTDKQTHSFRLRQIQNSLKVIMTHGNKINKGEDLKGIKGIGQGTIDRINEILEKGHLSEIRTPDEYKVHLEEMEVLEQVFGIGKTLSYEFVTKYGIHNIPDLVKAHNDGIINLTPQMLTSIKYLDRYKKNIPRDEMDKIDVTLHEVVDKVGFDTHIVLCGSYRRLKPSSNDIDVLLVNKKDENVLRKYVGELKKIGFIIDDLTFDYDVMYMGYCVLPDTGGDVRRIDIKYFPYDSYYTALLHFTGSGEFNQKLRHLAKSLGYKLSEYGLFKGNRKLKITSEKDVFDKLGLEYVPPEKR